MDNFVKRIVGDKKEWRRMEARAAALPGDYRIVYSDIQKYMWKFTAGNGRDTIVILRDLLGLFETAAADDKRALQITGEDVAAFCDELLRNAKTYTEKWREALNRDVITKLRDEETKP